MPLRPDYVGRKLQTKYRERVEVDVQEETFGISYRVTLAEHSTRNDPLIHKDLRRGKGSLMHTSRSRATSV